MINDETILAYVDGELDGAQSEAFEAAMAEDQELAARVARHAELRRLGPDVFADVLKEPVPERLRRSALSPVLFARERYGGLGAWRAPQLLAVAASLVIGVFVGNLLVEPTPLVTRSGQPAAGNRLAEALERQLGHEDGPVKIGISFRNHAGAYCRTFVMAEDGLSGLACKDDAHWTLQVAAPYSPPAGAYRMAGAALPPVVLAIVDEAIAGEPLDSEAEVSARDSNWR